jgi:hypothetical protein
MNNQELTAKYFEAIKPHLKGSNIFFEGDTLYSYGHHFILCQKVKNGYIINADRNSTSTAKHQRLTIRASPNNTPQIPYSAIVQIFNSGVNFINDLRQITILDKTEDNYITKKRLDSKTGEMVEYQEHHLGASLIRYKNKCYLSSIDSGSKGHAYFLVELPKQVNTVEDAFRILANNLITEEWKQYQEGIIKRLGEYFLIPTNQKTKTLKETSKRTYRLSPINNRIVEINLLTPEKIQKIEQIKKDFDTCGYDYDKVHHLYLRLLFITYKGKEYVISFANMAQQSFLPSNFVIRKNKGKYKIYSSSDKGIIKNFDLSNGGGNPHVATEAVISKWNNAIFIRGTLRHTQHKMISLGKIWHKVIKNTAKKSFTATGSVD